MFHSSHYHSNLVTTSFPCELVILQSVLHQNLTCQHSSSYCRIPMILDTLKNELKSPFTADMTKGFLLHADKNGEHICGDNLHGDNLNPHIMNKLSCSHQSPQETRHLCLPELCLCSVRPENQPSKIYESLTGKHIKYYNAGQVSQHPSLLDGNHHMSTFPVFTKYACCIALLNGPNTAPLSLEPQQG